MTRTLHCRVIEADVGERADVVLGRRIAGLSRRQARALGLAGKLRIDGRRGSPSTRVALDQDLAIELDEAEPSPALAIEPLAVTDDFVYVVKPAGVHTVALTPDQPGVLATAVAARWPECASASEDPREGGAVHRLDRPTSGIVAFARSREVWQRARAGFAEGRVTKLYLAVCRASTAPPWPPALPEGGLRGWIEPGDPIELPEAALRSPHARVLSLDPVRIRAPMGRADIPGRVAVRLEGRRASTVVQPIAESVDAGTRWLVGIRLETGQRHQARVHLAWIGLPIVGDHDYGGDAEGERGNVSGMIHLHALVLDLSALFRTEQPMLALPEPGFWPGPAFPP
jgi:23S rRNA pseudouridine1911/1915/1917 synthase